jgi:hypothetical protein
MKSYRATEAVACSDCKGSTRPKTSNLDNVYDQTFNRYWLSLDGMMDFRSRCRQPCFNKAFLLSTHMDNQLVGHLGKLVARI